MEAVERFFTEVLQSQKGYLQEVVEVLEEGQFPVFVPVPAWAVPVHVLVQAEVVLAAREKLTISVLSVKYVKISIIALFGKGLRCEEIYSFDFAYFCYLIVLHRMQKRQWRHG
jgi:hypothetical protein